METDDPSVELGAVLAPRNEDDKVHPIQYEIRMMNDAKLNYSSFKRESLTVLFSLKHFRLYFISYEPLHSITYQHSLREAFSKRDIHEQLLMWMDSLADN